MFVVATRGCCLLSLCSAICRICVLLVLLIVVAVVAGRCLVAVVLCRSGAVNPRCYCCGLLCVIVGWLVVGVGAVAGCCH